METTIEGLGFSKVASWESAPGYAGIEMGIYVQILQGLHRDYDYRASANKELETVS